MNKRVLLILGVVAILVASTALSGCIGGNKTTPTTPGATTTPTSTSTSGTSTGSKASTVVTGDKIVINGKTDQTNSTDFQVTEGTYIATYECRGTMADMFTSGMYSSDGKDGFWILALLGPASGSTAVVVGGMFTPAGTYHTESGGGDSYSITIEKPTSGVAAPQTFTLSKGGNKALAVNLNAGQVTVKVDHSVAPTGTTTMSLYDLEGNSVGSEYVQDASGTLTGEIINAGTYVLDVSMSANTGGSITISQ